MTGPIGIHHIYFVVTVPLGNEGQLAAVRRPSRNARTPSTKSSCENPAITFGVIAFLFPKDDTAGRKAQLHQYLTSVDNIERLTGLNFLTSLEDALEEELESEVATELWDGS